MGVKESPDMSYRSSQGIVVGKWEDMGAGPSMSAREEVIRPEPERNCIEAAENEGLAHIREKE